MAKKQTRRSISVSRSTYERLKTFCEVNNISMSQFVETRVGDFLGEAPVQPVTQMPAPVPAPVRPVPAPLAPPSSRDTRPAALPIPMTSAAARFAVEPPPPVIRTKQEQPAPKPAEKRPEQIFTF